MTKLGLLENVEASVTAPEEAGINCPAVEIARTAGAPQVLETALLVLLKELPNHGYGLVGPLRELGVDVGDLTRLYRALRKLESDGVVSSGWDTSAPGRNPPRKMYFITRSGQRNLRQRVLTLRATAQLMQRIEEHYLALVGEDG